MEHDVDRFTADPVFGDVGDAAVVVGLELAGHALEHRLEQRRYQGVQLHVL